MGVLRRKQKRRTEAEASPELSWPLLAACGPAPEYEYQVWVTNLSAELLSIADLYRQRADAENVYDELKNQWGWGGFMPQDQLRCQVAARNVALIYNWWSLFVRCAEPERPREAVTSRPLLLCAVSRVLESGRQIPLRLTSTHAQAAHAQTLLTNLSLFLNGLKNTAEQLSPASGNEFPQLALTGQPARLSAMKFFLAVLVYLLIGAVLSWGILLAMGGKPWLLIGSLIAYIVAFGKIGCTSH